MQIKKCFARSPPRYDWESRLASLQVKITIIKITVTITITITITIIVSVFIIKHLYHHHDKR